MEHNQHTTPSNYDASRFHAGDSIVSRKAAILTERHELRKRRLMLDEELQRVDAQRMHLQAESGRIRRREDEISDEWYRLNDAQLQKLQQLYSRTDPPGPRHEQNFVGFSGENFLGNIANGDICANLPGQSSLHAEFGLQESGGGYAPPLLSLPALQDFTSLLTQQEHKYVIS